MSFRIVVAGASTGGLAAMQTLLPRLPQDFTLPFVVVQHRGKESGTGLCDLLQRCSNLPVSEPEDKELIEGGHVYLAPCDYHLLVEIGSFALSTESPVWFARPSINVLFESAADAYGEDVIGVLLTGANADGARGLAAIKARGGMTIVEEPSTAQAREMPDAALALIDVDRILPLPEIAPFLYSLNRAVGRG
jgi:two-component system chemotaxis response regulator CheB